MQRPVLDPRLRPVVRLARWLERDEALPMPERRARMAAQARRGRWLVMPAGPRCRERDLAAPVEGGVVRVRLYEPPDGRGPLPLHVFLHGGGWCIGTLEERDPRCRQIAVGARCAVASVDYRLAPEHPYPVPLEDCYAALVWLVEQAADLGLDASRVSIGGESAGANLAAATCLVARDRGGPGLRHQWLDVPAVDLTLASPSVEEVPDGHLLDRATIDTYLDCYLPARALASEPYASPLLAASHDGLPPAWIMGCAVDKLRDDATRYAEALRAAGVPATCRILPGFVHAAFAFTRLLPAARAYEADAIAALARALHAKPPSERSADRPGASVPTRPRMRA